MLAVAVQSAYAATLLSWAPGRLGIYNWLRGRDILDLIQGDFHGRGILDVSHTAISEGVFV